MRADVLSSKLSNEIPELSVSQKLGASLSLSKAVNLQTVYTCVGIRSFV